MQNPDEIRREMDGQLPRNYDQRAPWRGQRSRPKQDRQVESRSKQPMASARASELGQYWYDLGTRSGFEFPYDANYFALALQRKIEHDPEMQPFLDKGKHEQVTRWVRKMIDIWWTAGNDEGGGYLNGEVQPRNAKEYFLGHDWEDVRDYARSSLRAAYLKEHGRKVEPPSYPNQEEYQQRLEEIRRRAKITPFLRHVDEAPQRAELDPKGRDRLRSWREKRRKK